MVDRTDMQSGRYKAYPEYKDSGVEWLGQIPSNWDVLTGKRFFSSIRKKALDTDEQLAASQKYGVIPQSLMMRLNDSKVMLALKGTDSFRHVEKDNFVISLRSFEGGIEHSDYTGCVSPAYTVLKSNIDIKAQYFKYLFKSGPYISALQSSTDSLRDGKSISYDQFGAIPLPKLSIKEQEKIASFLDYETAKIDILIEKQQRLIELLTEKRQAVISHAVTKGLNPDVPMKDSGVEWLGEVPEHWEVSSLRWFIDIASGKGLSSEELNKEKSESHPIPAVGGNGVMGFTNKVNTKDKALAIGRVGALCGNVHLIDYNAWITDNALKISRWRGFSQEYLAKLLEAANLNELASKTAQPLITGEQVKSLIIVIPPLSEQKEIASFIDKMHVQFNLLTQKAQQAIQLMQERRTALISAAVTGKIDVRDWVKPE